MRGHSQAAGALLSGALAAVTLFCGQHCGRTLPLAQGLCAAGSFLVDPVTAGAAAWQTLNGLVPETAEPEPDAPAGVSFPPQPTPEPPAAPTPAPAPTAPPEPAPPGAGHIATAHYPQGQGDAYVACGAGSIKNCTGLAKSDLADTIARGLPFAVEKNSPSPQVLIMHTHTTESYENAPREWYHPDSTSRTTDPARNVCAVGAALAEELNAAGIHTIQDTTLHDYPSYNGSYARSNKTVRAVLEQYPGIKVVIDVHRDAIIQKDGTWVKPLADLPGEGPCAQVMLICGADKGGNLPNFRQNLRFAAAWEEQMEALYPGLARPVLFDYRYYNQDLTTGSLLLEVGSHANTLEEAVTAGRLAGRALARALLG